MQVNFKGTEPQYMSLGAAGADLASKHDYTILPQEQVMIDTGTAVSIPKHSCAPVLKRCLQHYLHLLQQC